MTRPSPNLLRVLQVSDCHLPHDPKTPYRGLNADRNLVGLLPAMRRWQPDLVLLTGDVSEDGSAAAYGRVSAQLSTVGAPVLALPGNHDDAAVMRRYFPSGPWGGPSLYEKRNWTLILLDSTEPGRVSGELSDSALAQLERHLYSRPNRHVLIALHHQPVLVGSPWIDRYALERADAFWGTVDRFPQVRCVTWGHVHQGYQQVRGEMALLGAPSTVANSLPGRETFTLDLGGPACRWLELGAEGAIETGLLRAA